LLVGLFVTKIQPARGGLCKNPKLLKSFLELHNPIYLAVDRSGLNLSKSRYAELIIELPRHLEAV